VILHVGITLITLIMGFTPGIRDEWLSPSIVLCAFGCLNTCVFAFVEMWRTLIGISGSLPSWNWHNNGFLSSVGNIFFLNLFALPSLVIYVLHSLGYQFFAVLTEQQVSHPGIYGVIIFHLISGILVFFVDLLTIMTTTAKLRTFQSNRADEEEKEEKAPLETEFSNKKERPAGKTEQKKPAKDDDDDDGAEDYDEVRPVAPHDRILSLLSLLFHGIFTVDLIVLSASVSFNSGNTLSCIVMGLLFLTWLFYTIKCWNLKEVSESWLLNLRLLTILHLFAFLLFFWIALCVVLLLAQNAGTGFFSSIQTINDQSSERGTLASILIILIFVAAAIYGVILYVHSRSMWSLDEIASLYLAAKLQAKLKEDRTE